MSEEDICKPMTIQVSETVKLTQLVQSNLPVSEIDNNNSNISPGNILSDIKWR